MMHQTELLLFTMCLALSKHCIGLCSADHTSFLLRAEDLRGRQGLRGERDTLVTKGSY